MMAGIPIASGQALLPETAGGGISGVVVSQADKRPVANVVVSMKSETAGISRSVLTDYAGKFHLAGIPGGKYLVSIDEPGFQPLETDAQLDGSPVKLSLSLVEAKAPTGKLTNTVSVRELKIPYKAQEEFNKGLQQLGKNDLPESLNHFLKATRAFADYYEAFYHAGVVELKLDKKDEAMQAFQQAIDLSGGHYAEAQIGLGFVLYLKGQFPDAERVLRIGLDLDGNQADGHAILGMVLLQLNRLEDAEKSAREALLRNPNLPGAYLVLSDVYGRRKEYRQQLKVFDAYLKLQPSGPGSEQIRHARENTLTILAKLDPQN